MSTTTPNLSLILPTPNVDSGWGGTLNDNFDLIDDIFAAGGAGTSVGLNVGSGKTLTMGGTIVLGTGDASSGAAGNTIRGAAKTGTNQVGPNTVFDAGNGTGTGGSGKIVFRTAPAGSSGSTPNTLASALEVNAAGAIGIAGASYGTAGQVLLSNGAAAAPEWATVDGEVLTISGQAQGDLLYRGETAWERVPAGTAGQVLKSNGTSAPTWTSSSAAPNVIIQDQKSSGTDGGTFSSGADRTRELNTLVRNASSLASLSSNQFTLPAGTYYIRWSAPAFKVAGHQSSLYNVTDATTVGRGQSAYTNETGSYANTESGGSAVVTIASSKAFTIRHRCTSSQSGDGFGRAAGVAGTEVYTMVEIWSIPT